MEIIWEILKITIPLIAVMITAYFTLKIAVAKQPEKKVEEKKTDEPRIEKTNQQVKEVTMIRLQAYERLILFLERINPENMVMRMNKEALLASELHKELLLTIRTEFEHNVAQQLYISHQGWQLVVRAKNEVIKMINLAKQEMGDDENNITLSKKIIVASGNSDILLKTKMLLKDEAQKLF